MNLHRKLATVALAVGALVVVMIASGCPTLQKLEPPAVEYVKADVLFSDLVLQRFIDYVEADMAAERLTATQGASLIRAASDWHFAVKKGAEANELPPPKEPSLPAGALLGGTD